MAVTLLAPFDGDDFVSGTSRLLLYTASDRANAHTPETITVQNTDAAAIVTVGGATVASKSNGIILAAQYDLVSIDLKEPGTEVWVIADTTTTTVTATRA